MWDYIAYLLAQQRAAELHREAEAGRLAALARSESRRGGRTGRRSAVRLAVQRHAWSGQAGLARPA